MEKKEKEKRIELVLLFAMTNIERRETRILDIDGNCVHLSCNV